MKDIKIGLTVKILIADDDPHIRDVVRFTLEDAGHSVHCAENGKQALDLFREVEADLVILDIGMPEKDGFATCRELRETSQVPILFLTARDEEIDRVLGFELGGDDYVSKPFSPRELALRVRAILARGAKAKPQDDNLSYGDLSLSPASHECRLGGQEIPLTRTEFSLLEVLVRAPERVLNRNQLIDQIYGGNSYLSGRTVDSHLRNLRQKASKIGYEDVVQTIHGVGIKLGSCRK